MAEQFNPMDLKLTVTERTYSKHKVDRFSKKLVKGEGNFLMRHGSECDELIFDGVHYVFATDRDNFPQEMIYLFNMVQRDVVKHLSVDPVVILPPKVNVTEYNFDYDHDKGNLTATDLDHAFWRIAYIKNYITKSTYERGLNPLAKALRLASLSVLGREKRFDKYENGKFKETVIAKPFNKQLHDVYLDIRYSCYYMMYELSLLLGDDFDCWKTDCINYRDTPENRELVQKFFEEREMLYKQLTY